jgi:hypothetical protein
MDVISQSGQQSTSSSSGQNASHSKSTKKGGGGSFKAISVVLLVSAALLMGSLALYLGLGGTKDESKYVDKTKFQAVFLNGGQVYFGKIRTLNNRFITVDNIYYLRVNQQVQPNQSSSGSTAQDVSLAKLGCELHGPTDVMVINREQVLFWENLKDDGQVVKAITDFVKANPQGQKCETPATNNNTTTPTTEE